MATSHAVFNIPVGVIGIAFYQVLSDPERLGAYISPLWTVFLLSMSVSLFGSLTDFFIYLYVFAAFRESASNLASKCCLGNDLNSLSDMHNNSEAANTSRSKTGEQMNNELHVHKKDPYDVASKSLSQVDSTTK